jgi:hypothetical protein
MNNTPLRDKKKSPRFKPKPITLLKEEISEQSITLLDQLYTKLLEVNRIVTPEIAERLWEYQWQELTQRKLPLRIKEKSKEALCVIKKTAQIQTFKDLVDFQQKILITSGRLRESIRIANMQVFYPTITRKAWRAPSQKSLPKLIEELDRFLQEPFKKDTPLIKICLVQYLILTVHPFCDGNGRVSRLILPHLLPRDLPFRLQGVNYYFKSEEFYNLIAEVSAFDFPGDINIWIQGWSLIVQSYLDSLHRLLTE